MTPDRRTRVGIRSGTPDSSRPPSSDWPPDDHEDEGDLDGYIKEIVDLLPPLTSEQRDLLALIFRQHRR